MTWLDFIALTLATGTLVNAWLYDESILASMREWVLAWSDIDDAPGTARSRIRVKIGELLACRFCMSHWVPGLLIAVLYLPSMFLLAPWSTMLKLPIYALAITRGALCLGILMRRLRVLPPDFEQPGDNQE